MNRKELLFFSIGVFLTVIASFLTDIYRVVNARKPVEKSEITEIGDFRINQQLLDILEQKTQ